MIEEGIHQHAQIRLIYVDFVEPHDCENMQTVFDSYFVLFGISLVRLYQGLNLRRHGSKSIGHKSPFSRQFNSDMNTVLCVQLSGCSSMSWLNVQSMAGKTMQRFLFHFK